MVPHDEVTLTHFPGDAIAVDDTVQSPVEDDGRIVQLAEGDRDGDAVENVVYNVVPDEDLDGICSCEAAYPHVDDRLLVVESFIRFCNGDVVGSVYGLNAVPWNTTGENIAARQLWLEKSVSELAVILPHWSGVAEGSMFAVGRSQMSVGPGIAWCRQFRSGVKQSGQGSEALLLLRTSPWILPPDS
jgi:hypothetical protein